MAAGGGGGSVPRDPTEAVLHGVAIVKASGSGEPLVLSIAHNTSQFSFFAFGASSTLKEINTFCARSIPSRVGVGRKVVEHEGQFVCTLGEQPGLFAVAITNADYPPRVALAMCREVLDAFKAEAGVTWASAVKDGEFDSFKGCSEALTEWADPTKKDKLTSVHVKTEQVKEELVKTLESVLRRGEKIEELVQASTDLSESSKAFYKKSRSLNRCCTIM